MADYGLITKNDSGGIQIDSNYRNFVIQAQGNATPNPPDYHTGYTAVSIPSSIEPPLVLIKPSPSYFTTVVGFRKSGSYYNGFYVGAGDHPPEDFTSFPSSFGYIVGRMPTSYPSDAYGLVVKNASGETCFHSGAKYVKILSHRNISVPSPDPQNGNYPYVDISHPNISYPYYFISPVATSVAVVSQSPPPYVRYRVHKFAIGIKRLSSTYARIRNFVFGYYEPTYPWSSYYCPTSFTLLICK